jgi:hypothetical protein
VTLPSARIIFDENFGAPHLERLRAYIAGQPGLEADVLHTLDFQKAGVWDENWIPQKAAEGWIIISQDRAKNTHGGKKGEPLPKVCVKHRVTHVLLTSSAAKQKMLAKIQLIISVWPQIVALHSEPRGSRFSLAVHPSIPTQGRLINRTPKEFLEEIARESARKPELLFDPDNPP